MHRSIQCIGPLRIRKPFRHSSQPAFSSNRTGPLMITRFRKTKPPHWRSEMTFRVVSGGIRQTFRCRFRFDSEHIYTSLM